MSNNGVLVDPEFAGLIPPLSDDELAGLTERIKADKRCDPLVAWKGQRILLDGHNRKRICEKFDIPYDVREVDLPDRLAAEEWIILNQFSRRNISTMQRAELANRLKAVLVEKGKETKAENLIPGGKPLDPVHWPGSRNSSKNEDSYDEAAKKSGSSKRAMKAAEILHEKAEPAVLAMARKGDVPMAVAAEVAKLPKAEQAAVAKAGPAAVKAKAAEVRKAKAEPPEEEDLGTDRIGVPIEHAHVTEAFAQRKLFTSLMHRVSQLKKEFEELAMGPAGNWARHQAQMWNADVSNLHSVIRFSIPHAVCPYCGGRKCEACKNAGWMPEDVYKRVPADIKA